LGAALEAGDEDVLQPDVAPLRDLYQLWAYGIAFEAAESARRAAADSETNRRDVISGIRGRGFRETFGREFDSCMDVPKAPPIERDVVTIN